MPKIANYIKLTHYINSVGILSSFILFLLTLSILIPINLKGEKTIAASGDTSTTSLTLSTTSGSAELDLLVTSDSGTFASSASPLTFSASTNNYTGYTLSIKSATSSTNLTNSTKDANNNTVTTTFASLSSTNAITKNGITATTFNSSTYNGQWGFKPSYYNSTANSDKFYPSPDDTGVTLNRTNCANGGSNGTYTCPNSSDSYTISIGARATYAQVAGAYTNKYILSAVGNYPQYSITYTDLSGSASNMPTPNPQSITSINNDSVSVALSSTEPTRTGYTFSGWCIYSNSNDYTKCPSSNNGTNNTGTKYSKGANYNLDLLNSNTIPLYAVWTVNQYDCVKRYRLQNADGTWGSYTTESTTKTDYNTTCSYSKSVTDYKASASGTNNSEASTSGTVTTSGVTLSLDFYRNTYALTVNRNTSYISSASATTTAVHSSNYYRWGQSVAITAMASSDNKFTTWSQTAGTGNGTTTNFASATSASTTFTMPKSNVTVYAGGVTDKIYMQDLTITNCQKNVGTNGNSANIGDNITVYDRRDGSDYTVRYINGLCWMTQNLRIMGTISAEYSNFTGSDFNVSQYDIYNTTYCSPGDSSAPKGYINACSHDSGNTSTGAWYNYAAATAGTIATYQNSDDAAKDICPANWHLPTGPNTINGTDYNKLVGNTTNNWQTTTGLVAFGAVAGGGFTGTSISYPGQGRWWSATAGYGYSYDRHYLLYSENDNLFYSGNHYIRTNGIFVRCVRSS